MPTTMRPSPILTAALLLTLALPARAQAPDAPAPEAAPSEPAASPAAPEAAPAEPESTPTPAADEPPAATPHAFSAVATPDQVKLGESFRYVIEIRDAKDQRYELPRELSLGKDFDLVKVDVARTPKDGETVTRFTLEAALFDLGEKRIPDIDLQVTGPAGARRLKVPGPPVTGVGVLDDEQEPKLGDIMPPVEVPVTRWNRLYWILAGIAAAVALLLLVRWLRRRPPRPVAAPVAPAPAPAHERAMRALEELQREDLPTQGRGREFHFRLSEILRDYLGERFGFSALDMTTEELLAALQRLPTPGLDYAKFEAFCREGDLVKFAKAPAPPAECKVAIEAAFGFVRSTAPQAPGPRRPGPTAGAAA